MRGVVSAMLSRTFCRSSRAFLSESVCAIFSLVFCSRSYLFLSSRERPAYQASNAAFARAVESARYRESSLSHREVSSWALNESRGLRRTTVSTATATATVSAGSSPPEVVSRTVISSSDSIRRSLYPATGYTTVSCPGAPELPCAGLMVSIS